MTNPSSSDDKIKRVLDFFDVKGDAAVSPERQEKIIGAFATIEKMRVRKERKDSKAMKPFKAILSAEISQINSAPVESPIESELLIALNTRSICCGRAVPQHPVGPYTLDIAFLEIKLAVECDGKAYHSTPGQIAHDQRRTEYLVALGWTVLRFTGTEIRRSLYVCVDRVVMMYDRLAAIQEVKESWE